MSDFPATRRALTLLAVALAWLLGGASDAAACSCVSVTVCEAFGRADAVFVGAVASQRETEREAKLGNNRPFKVKTQVSLLHVEEVFSGLGGVTEVEIETDLSTSCAFPLAPGVRYLIYASRGEGAEAGRLATGMCARSGRVEHRAEDLEYLRRGGAALAGAVVVGEVAYVSGPAGAARETVVADTVGVTTVVAAGGGRRAEARVGAGGRYQFKGLPPGKYHVSVPLPDELTVLDEYHPDIAEEMGIKRQHEIEVPARGCVVKHLHVGDNGRLSGRVTDAEGAPVAGLKIELRRPREPGAADDEEEDDDADEDLYIRTDDDGQYSFKGLPAGRYLIGVRLGKYLSDDEPAIAFRRTFYPGVSDEREAVVVSLGRGQSVTRRDFQLGPRLRERPINGVVVQKDGRPAAGVTVRFQMRSRDRERISVIEMEADERGRFSISGFDSTAYLIGAYAKSCPAQPCLHAHEVEVGPSGTRRPVRLVLDQPGKSCGLCRYFDEFMEGQQP
jgi:5-hydroxyisourate hydrolase-like protein (transthyretin family)